MKPTAEILFNYLHDVIYDPPNAVLDVENLPEDFRDFGNGLQYFAECVMETKTLAQSLAKGDLTDKLPRSGNEIAAPLKSLHASLKHLTWQAQQIARGDYQQRVSFMGDFAGAFNTMAGQLEKRRKIDTQEKSKLQQYINLVLSSTPNILLAFDTEGKAVFASESYLRRCKISSADKVHGKSFSELLSPVVTEEFLLTTGKMLNNALANLNTSVIEQNIDFGQDGCLRTYLFHVSPILHENNMVMGTLFIFDDMTEIIQARHAAERALKLAGQSARAKSDFLARMSHEMRTPMNAIIGMSTIGKKNADNAHIIHCFENITEASNQLLNVINDIFDISEIESDNLQLSYQEFNFVNMLDNIKNTFQVQTDKQKQKFTTDIDGNIPLNIISDEKRLTQVITNILSNAVKFTPENGSISLTAKKTNEADGYCTISFTVKDTGIGISQEQQKKLFIPFEQADGGTSRKFGGTGLGLAISKRILEMMGGNIYVESEPGKGSSFTFEITVQIKAVTETSAETELIPINNIFLGKKIMIAEDVEINREIISTLLEETGVEIDFAFNGVKAVDKFISNPGAYEFIFMDIRMPEMDGYEATKLIRSSGLPEAEKIPIIAMTANISYEDIERCFAAGMNGHLGKPIDVDKVIEKLREYLL
ncbi:MAG: ATP-binding protein [Spirochaetaceae bacterium]|nr:ATP-binding protein [Spirochaetaceae bacterium]